MPERDRFRDLIELLLSNRITPGEMRELAEGLEHPALAEGLDAVLKDSYYQHADTAEERIEEALRYLETIRAGMEARVLGDSPANEAPPGNEATPARKIIRFPLTRWAAAALVLLSLGGAAYFFSIKKNTSPQPSALVRHFGGDVKPGGNKAILTLGDQSTITLDDAQNGQLASQGGSNIIKKGGTLLYAAGNTGNATGPGTAAMRGNATSPGNDTALVYNTITTPAGGQYQLVLADGSRVWLDSKSSIRFPTTFNRNSREVDVTGQVYLEVAAHPGKPFRVRVKDQVVEVLGTRFNINAFDNEGGIKTTLAEGAVRVLEGNKTLLLHPGEQARAIGKNNLEWVPHPDMEETLAWKDGLFHFDGTDIAVIMRQMARWYDLDIEYKDTVQGSFVADIPRNVPLSQVLQLLELTGHVHFRIDGRKIIVSG
jgi:transmembrane sensor